MKKLHLLAALLVAVGLHAQKQPLTYYLPDIKYDPDIPTPESFLGYQIGEWHISHDQQLFYLRALAAASPRVTITEYARTYENRPLVYLTITSEANHGRLEQLRQEHLALSRPGKSPDEDMEKMPLVVYQGFSIHGNEPSGGNAAPLVAYYLAAGQSDEVRRTLEETVILLDPCFNPDGFHRFSTWANMHKNLHLTDDSQDREYNEAWPRGRTNHYWFDLNRDWLPAQHPESRGRLQVFHDWKPNILTDHHEMGTNATFFFMPGVPERTNPITPWENQELTGRIGAYHAAALDEIGSLYYSQEGYDDFYYGKGSTYPDANGCIGILFEQASSRGHLQATINGPLSFSFTIRNQVATALSTQKAAVGLRTDLLDYQRRFAATPPGAVLDGRDIGTVVCPEADHKLFVTADVEVRAERRYKELQGRGTDVIYAQILRDLRTRDERDSRRAVAPLVPADDAFILDTSTLTADEAFERAYAHIVGGGPRRRTRTETF
ncbi:MAG: (d)CMP kinase [Phaeodactylibacter sp.]|nr:(d)CMP kinase [Phaeodactylibacter sp.]